MNSVQLQTATYLLDLTSTNTTYVLPNLFTLNFQLQSWCFFFLAKSIFDAYSYNVHPEKIQGGVGVARGGGGGVSGIYI